MGLSRSTRIKTLLVIDTAFFFLEIIVGYAVGSLALVADSFHMLNDVCSLIVALYAIKLAEQNKPSNQYTYGWQRAEVLGALINGVFLLALCLSICLEAISRFFSVEEINSPKIVVIVGSFGLLSNIIGLALFHEHGHGHGHSHSHSHEPEQIHQSTTNTHSIRATSTKSNRNGTSRYEDETTQPLLIKSRTSSDNEEGDQSGSEDEQDWPIPDDLYAHPAQTRANVVRQAQGAGWGSSPPKSSYEHGRPSSVDISATSRFKQQQNMGTRHSASSSLPASMQFKSNNKNGKYNTFDSQQANNQEQRRPTTPEHSNHKKNQNSPSGTEVSDETLAASHHGHGHDHGHGHGHGHSHGSMNMRGVFLHVLGDALGNVGVIATGLLIWLTTWSGRFYFDPAISLVISIIILHSALPLVRSASFILLQGVPPGIPLEQVRQAIMQVPEVLSLHELHVWSLSESKVVASTHVLVRSHDDFVAASQGVRHVLHRFGIHSSTIQPEVVRYSDNSSPPSENGANNNNNHKSNTNGNGNVTGDDSNNLIESPSAITLTQAQIEALDNNSPDQMPCFAQCIGTDNCAENACCPPQSLASIRVDPRSNQNSTNDSSQ